MKGLLNFLFLLIYFLIPLSVWCDDSWDSIYQRALDAAKNYEEFQKDQNDRLISLNKELIHFNEMHQTFQSLLVERSIEHHTLIPDYTRISDQILLCNENMRRQVEKYSEEIDYLHRISPKSQEYPDIAATIKNEEDKISSGYKSFMTNYKGKEDALVLKLEEIVEMLNKNKSLLYEAEKKRDEYSAAFDAGVINKSNFLENHFNQDSQKLKRIDLAHQINLPPITKNNDEIEKIFNALNNRSREYFYVKFFSKNPEVRMRTLSRKNIIKKDEIFNIKKNSKNKPSIGIKEIVLFFDDPRERYTYRDAVKAKIESWEELKFFLQLSQIPLLSEDKNYLNNDIADIIGFMKHHAQNEIQHIRRKKKESA